MKRFAFASPLALLVCTAAAGSVFAQAQPAAPTTPAPVARAKFAAPIKGEAHVEVIQGGSKYVGKEIVTVYRVRNTSAGPIALLKVEEYWYDKAGKMVSYDEQRHRRPLAPGEIVEITTRAPQAPGVARNQATFSHANGKIKAKAVKKFPE